MTSGQRCALLVALVAAAGAVWYYGGLSAKVSVRASASTEGQQRAAAGQMSDEAPGVCERHPLHRRYDGHRVRDGLQNGGWAWYANPPAAEEI